eukprot:1333550-Pyramimonas_sp.AAC.1
MPYSGFLALDKENSTENRRDGGGNKRGREGASDALPAKCAFPPSSRPNSGGSKDTDYTYYNLGWGQRQNASKKRPYIRLLALLKTTARLYGAPDTSAIDPGIPGC